MSRWNSAKSDEESDDEEYDGPDAFKGRDGIIFLVDAYLSNDEEKFKNVLELIYNALLSGLLTREKDLVGIAFWNTKNSPDPKDTRGMESVYIRKNTAVFLPLKQLSKESVDYFIRFLDSSDNFDFSNCWGIENGSFGDALGLCINMLKQCGHKLLTSTIIYLTDRDTPHQNDADEFQKAILKAKDLDSCEVDFVLFPLNDDFDYDNFFKEFICTIKDIDLDEFVEPDIEQVRKNIAIRNLKQNHRNNCLAHLKWELGNGVQLSVALYNYYRKSVYPKCVKLCKADNTPIDVKIVRKISVQNYETNESDEKYMMPGDERKVLEIGGKKISFTSDEVMKMRCPLSPGIRLLGFKSNSTISLHKFAKSSSFLYPDENIIKGSTILFRTLWEKCIEKQKVAICVIVPRRKSTPYFTALEPVQADSSNNWVKRNDVFRVIYLPFEEDYRNLNLSNYVLPDVPENGIELFQKIIKKLKIKYSPDSICDPFLEELHGNIINTAFERGIVSVVNERNGGMPDVKMQNERIEMYLNELTEIFGQDLEISKTKRKADDNDEGRPPKAPKITDECPNTTTIQQLYTNNQLNVLTVKQLRNYLQENNVGGVPNKATKAALIEKIIDFITA